MTTPTGILFSDPQVKPLSTTGQPQAAAYLYFYLTGTTTQTNVYADGLLTTPLSQPVTADSSGRFVPIYLNPSTVYRVQLYNAGGSKLEDTDPYVPLAVSQAVVGAALWPQTAAETTASVTPSVYSDIPGNAPAGDVRRYGAKLDGATDDSAALLAACKVGGEIVISGPMAILSNTVNGYAGSTIPLLSGTRIRCTNGGSITITGSAAINLFTATNTTGISFADVTVTGNNVGTSALGYFCYFLQNASATGPTGNVSITGCNFTNFPGYYWIYFDSTLATTYPTSNIVVRNNRFTSMLGNSQGSSNILITASCLGFIGSTTVTTFATMTDIVVTGNVADGTFIKTFVDIWSGCNRVVISNNNLKNFGTDSSFSNDVGCYAINIYDFSHATALPPDTVVVDANVIQAVRSCGVYIAGTGHVTVTNNQISDQTDTVITTLPKGAIAGVGSAVLNISGNQVDNCAFGIMSLQPPTVNLAATPTYCNINDNSITNIPVNGFGLVIGGTGGGSANSICVDGIYIDDNGNAGTTAIRIAAESVAGITDLVIRNFKIKSTTTGIIAFSGDSSVPALGNVHISNGEIRGVGNYGMNLTICTSTSQRLVVENIVFNNPQAGAQVFFIPNVVQINVRNLTFCDMTTGSSFCWSAGSAQGTVEGVRFQNVATARRFSGASNEMGSSSPIGVYAGNDTDFQQNLNPQETGTTSSKYILMGYQWDVSAVAWKQCRSLTGN